MARCPLADTLPYVSQAHKWDLGLKMQGTGYPHLEQGQPSHGLEVLALPVGGRERLRVENLGVSGGLSCSPLWQQRTLHGAGWAGVATKYQGPRGVWQDHPEPGPPLGRGRCSGPPGGPRHRAQSPQPGQSCPSPTVLVGSPTPRGPAWTASPGWSPGADGATVRASLGGHGSLKGGGGAWR